MCIGESTTASGGDYSYPSQLERVLNARGKGVTFTVINKGVWATKIAAIAGQLDPYLDTYSPQMVIAMLGINDERLHLPNYNPQFLPSRFAGFISSLRTFKLICLIVDNVKYFIARDAFYVSRGDQRSWRGEWGESEKDFIKSLELNPHNSAAYIALGRIYDYLDRKKEAERMFQKAVELDPGNYKGYEWLGTLYTWQGLNDKAESMFRKAIEVASTERTYLDLSWFYRKTGRTEEAVKVLESFQSAHKSDVFYGSLGELYRLQGKNLLAEECFSKADETRNSGYHQKTYTNYRIIANKVLRRGIKLVCVQYPVRPLEPLKKTLEGYNEAIFVDNEKIFKEAVSRNGYDYYFWDKYGGDFGHCTEEGNRLLAKNIAATVLKELGKH